jgi:hypothetical protein
MNRKRLILILLLAFLVGSVVWSYYSYPRPKTVKTLKYRPGARAVAGRTRVSLVKPGPGKISAHTLRLDLLEQQPAMPDYQRDIFKPIFVDRETMLARQAAAAAAEAARRARKAMAAAKPVKPPPVPVGIQRELANFVFHGFLNKDGRMTVFLAKGKDIYPVRPGTVFAGRYRVTALTDQVLSIKTTDTGDEVLIPVIEGRTAR